MGDTASSPFEADVRSTNGGPHGIPSLVVPTAGPLELVTGEVHVDSWDLDSEDELELDFEVDVVGESPVANPIAPAPIENGADNVSMFDLDLEEDDESSYFAGLRMVEPASVGTLNFLDWEREEDSPNIFPASPNRASVSGDLTDDNSCEPDAEALSSPAVDGIAQTLRDLREDGKRQKEELLKIHERRAKSEAKLRKMREDLLREEREHRELDRKRKKVENKVHLNSRKVVKGNEVRREAIECPVCTEEMLPPKSVFQCRSGHPVCSNCRPKVNKCPTCRQAIIGRNIGMEAMIRMF